MEYASHVVHVSSPMMSSSNRLKSFCFFPWVSFLAIFPEDPRFLPPGQGPESAHSGRQPCLRRTLYLEIQRLASNMKLQETSVARRKRGRRPMLYSQTDVHKGGGFHILDNEHSLSSCRTDAPKLTRMKYGGGILRAWRNNSWSTVARGSNKPTQEMPWIGEIGREGGRKGGGKDNGVIASRSLTAAGYLETLDSNIGGGLM